MTTHRFPIIFILVISLGFVPVIMADPEDPPGQTNPVENFLQAAKDFVDTLNTAPGFKKQEYLDAIDEIKGSVETLPDEDAGYVAADYFDVVSKKWESMKTEFTKSSHPYKDNIKQEYAESLASYIKGDCRSIVNSWQATDYSAYYESLNEMYSTRLSTTVSTTKTTRHSFDPLNYLDRGAPGVTKDPVRVNVASAGIYDKWAGYNIRKMVSSMQSKYYYDAQLQEDLNWFLKVWPAGSEVDITTFKANGQTISGGDYGTANYGSGSEIKVVNANYTVNEYGQPTSDELPSVLSNYGLVDQVYCDRQYGYNPSTKTGYGFTGSAYHHIFSTVSIQVGDRKYQLYDALAISPIVLDLDGDGNLEASKGEYLPHPYNGSRLVEFDINGDDFLELTEWVGPTDGLLMQYNNEKDLNANYFFGEAGGFSDGYEKLSLLDANNDKLLSGDELKTLSVWQDANSNAKIDTGELSSVATLGITSISLNHEDLIASFTQNGVSKKMWDWYPVAFRVKRTR